MASEKWMEQMYNGICRSLRMEDKARENSWKPALAASDIVETRDFVFSAYQPYEKNGDSGALLIAKRKTNRSERYVVKHAYADCAANEYVYTKLAQAIGLKMPDAVLFKWSDDEKRRYWKTEYILGTRYLENAIVPTQAQIKMLAKNPDDLFRFHAMERLCHESDGIEYLLAEDGFLYRIDTTASFILSHGYFFGAGINEIELETEFDGRTPKEKVKQHVSQLDFEAYLAVEDFQSDLDFHKTRFGHECVAPYLDTYKRLTEIPDTYIDDFLNTLCYIYPDFIGDYFKKYIVTAKRQAAKFLQTMNAANF